MDRNTMSRPSLVPFSSPKYFPNLILSFVCQIKSLVHLHSQL